MRGVLVTACAVALVLGALLVSSSGAASVAKPSARAVLAGGSAGVHGAAAARGTDEARGEGGVDASGVHVASGQTSARTSVAGRRARAAAIARSVNLLDGRVTADVVRRTVSATGKGRVYDGRVEGLQIDGTAIGDVTDGQTFDLADGSGQVTVNTGSIGLRLVLTRNAGGLLAGTDVRLAVATARVKLTAVSTPTPTPTATATPAPTGTPKPKREDLSGGKARKTRLKRKAAPKVPKRLTASGFAFPIYGKARIADTFGASRAAPIVTHEGDDVFADFGSPVVAVADGKVSRVGTLDISGNRLWVTSDDGDAFFYAHLSAFSPAAVDGAHVKAGTVLGFVGNTGDAEPTPPHLHFEVHPGGEEEPAVDPYPILSSWQGRRDVATGAWLQRNGEDTTQRPGALVAVEDFIAR